MYSDRRHGSRIPAMLLFLSGAACVYAAFVRPRLVRWGVSDDEVKSPFPGADIIPRAQPSSSKMAVIIDAPPSKVWPWLLQMGCGRGGWYSFDRLDNFGLPSADSIHTEWQNLSVGDHLPALPDGSQWWEVAALEPERFLGLRMSVDLHGRPFDPNGPRPRYYTDSLWGFALEQLAGGRTRLVVSGYWAFEPRWLQPALTYFVFEPTHVIMQLRQFQKLKRRVEAPADVALVPVGA
jgi:hypothetical protein